MPNPNWDKYKDSKFYPWRCGCGCNQAIPVLKKHKYYKNLPKYLPNHHSNQGKRWGKVDPEVEAILKGEKEAPFCGCNCGERIIVTEVHHNTGVPKYIRGHQGSFAQRPDVRKKMSEARRGKSVFHTDITKEMMKYQHGILIEGPNYWKTFEDLAIEGARLYGLTKGTVRRSMLRLLKVKNLTQLDIVIFLNFTAGHNFIELAERYLLSPEEVIQTLKRIEKVYPKVTQSGKSFPANNMVLSFDILYHWAWNITYRW